MLRLPPSTVRVLLMALSSLQLKKGQAGARPTISYDGNVSVSTVKSTVDVMDGDQFRSFIKDIWGEDSEAYRKLGNANTDWQKEISAQP